MKLTRWLVRAAHGSIVEIEGIRIRIPSVASDPIREAIRARSYEAAELALLKGALAREDVVMEVGTGLGLLSAYCAKHIGDDRVYTFEANPALEEPIRANYALNRVAPTLEIGLVGHQVGPSAFYVGENFWSSSVLNKARGAKPITAPAISFNDKVKEIDPSFLLLDIEGGEYDLVRHADFRNVRKLVIEIHNWILTPAQVQYVQDTLVGQGFRLFAGAGREEQYFVR
ncbi:MAG TPA: FkbM family methyltransferase [Methylomirabilota bacterium]|nr:FkbM family methyltransferase [Methylomirabilota bacterium]